MFTVRNVRFDSENSNSIKSIRDTVFTIEQGISKEIEFDGNDKDAIHALISKDGTDVGTGRVLNDGHIGRIAILRPLRGAGLGSKIVLSLINAAKDNGCKRVYLGAQKHAIPFYSKLGFTQIGEDFMEAGIEHVSMEKFLD